MNKKILEILGKGVSVIALSALMIAPRLLSAHGHHSMGKTSPEFDKIKQLVGTWGGTTTMMGEKEPMNYTVTYELTAGGTAILEREFAGSPHEMVSVYYMDGNHLDVTHYCMMGNQPHMILDKVSGNTLSFDLEGTSGLASSTVPHMHHLNLTLVDADHIKQTWTEYEGGKKAHTTVLELTRKS